MILSPSAVARNRQELVKDFEFELNSRLVVRCNGEIKETFEELCARFGRKPSIVIRDYMLSSIHRGSI